MRAIGLLCLLAVGCATGYHAADHWGGYTDTQLAERVYEIRFFSNQYTHQATDEAYTLRRAAEVALAHGFDGFTEVKDNEPGTALRIYLLSAEEMRELPAAIDARIILARWGAVPPKPAAPVLAKPNWDAPGPKVTE